MAALWNDSMSSTLVLVGIVGFVLAIVALLWREVRARKRIWAQRRLNNAELKGMTIEEYDAWMKSLDDEIYRIRMKQIHDDQGIQDGQESG